MTEFEKIYETYFSDVFLYIKSLSKNESIAEEITSETFFRAMRSIDKFRGDCDIRVWLCQIAKNCFYSYLKKHPDCASLEEISSGMTSETSNDFEEQITRHSDAMQIHSILHGLTEPYKEVFMLRVFGELSFQQIGMIFSKTENWACVTYHRARKKIIQELEDRNNDKQV